MYTSIILQADVYGLTMNVCNLPIVEESMESYI